MHMFLSQSFADLGVLETEDRGPFTETYKTHSWPYEQTQATYNLQFKERIQQVVRKVKLKL